VKFWNWITNAAGERALHLDGVIAKESWWGDEVTPAAFKSELTAGSGPVTVWINSPGGDVFAAAQIYNMLKEYTGSVTVKIDGVAASAASVIAMAGGEVLMSPVSMMMIHNPSTIAWGDSDEMLRAKALLDAVKESIVNAYELKTGKTRAELSRLMDSETWMSAHKAVEMGFADKVLFDDTAALRDNSQGFVYNRMAVTNSLLNKINRGEPKAAAGVQSEQLYKRLALLKR
jgi:ATP-dependent Clp protease protease subunit